jgi:hypothetical protein
MKKASAKRLDEVFVVSTTSRQWPTNLMLIEPDLAEVFCDAESVNRALRLLVDTASRV